MHAHDHKETVRLTFDCPEELHAAAKMKAAARKEPIKDYIIGLVIKDLMENTPKIMDQADFRKHLEKVLKDDADLLRKLSKR